MDNPIYHLPYSPNWFLPEIMSFSPDQELIALGINNYVHIINFKSKTLFSNIFP